MHAVLGIGSVRFVVEYVVHYVIDSCSDGEFESPAWLFLEFHGVAKGDSSADCRSAAFVVLDSEFSVEGEVVPAQAEVCSAVESVVVTEVVSYFRLKYDASELDCFLDVVHTS